MSKKKLCMAAALLALWSFGAYSSAPQLIFQDHAGNNTAFHKVSEIDRLTFSPGSITVQTADGISAYNPTDLGRVVFDNEGTSGTRIDNAMTGSNVKVSPNPFVDFFSVNVPGKCTLAIYSLTGSLLINIPGYEGGNVDTSSLSPGLYIVKTDSLTAKIIKK